MKWCIKGHELDNYAEDLLNKFRSKQREIYIFGAGLIGAEIKAVLERYGCFSGFIDNDLNKQKNGVGDGDRVFSLEEYLARGGRGLIVIAADEKNIPAIREQLCSVSLEEGKDFYNSTEFMERVFPVLSVYEYNLTYVSLVQISLTERCSLKCKYCAHGCFAVDAKSQDMSLDAVKRSADYFFKMVDVVKEFVLIGGEPFLYNDLVDAIKYIGDKYRDRMTIFSITTNGTIIPKNDVLDICQKYNVMLRISNYSATLPHLETRYSQLCEVLNQKNITYVLGDKEFQWKDYGFTTVNREENEGELLSVFDTCKTICREIRENKYYYCVMARSVSENLRLGLGENDYLDLDKLDYQDDKKVFLEYQLGYSEKGYLDMCNHCNGADAFKHPIPAAEQA